MEAVAVVPPHGGGSRRLFARTTAPRRRRLGRWLNASATPCPTLRGATAVRAMLLYVARAFLAPLLEQGEKQPSRLALVVRLALPFSF